MVRLILGRAGAGKTARVFSEIADAVREKRGGVVLLVPEQYSHEAERELCRAAGDAMSLYGEVLSFTGLARKVFDQCGGARPVMDGGGRLLCMAVAADAVAGSLRVYGRARRNARLLDSLQRAVQELRNAGIGAAALSDAAARFPGALGEKLCDLALLSEAYAAAEGRSAADPADVMETLAALIGDSLAVRGTFYIDGFSDFTELEKNVLRELIRAGADMTVCLTLAPDGGEEGVFALASGTRRWLLRTAEEYGQAHEELWAEREGPVSALSYYGEHLFDFTPGEPPQDDGSVRLVTASDAYEECELAASYISSLAREGARWREIAVAARGFGDYRAALENACRRYDIPLFLSGRGDMLQKSVPLLIASALEAVVRGYEYEAVFGCLKTGLAPLPAEECDRLENYVILWNVRGSMWERPFTMHPEGYNRPFDDRTRAALDDLNAQRERVIAPLKRFEAAAKRADTAVGQAHALADFLVDIELPERLDRRAQELDASGRAEAAAEYERLWDVVCTALEQFAAVLGDMRMDAERFRELFCLMLSKYDTSVIPVSLDRVQAEDMDGMRRRHIKHLVVLGATDGRLPAPDEGAGVFTMEEREELTALGLSMGGAEESLSRELGLIYSCLTLPSESLYISRPLIDADGAETRPSLLAERAWAMLGVGERRGELLPARTLSREAAFELAVRGAAGSREPVCRAARDYFEAQGRGGELSALVSAAEAGRGALNAASVRALYGSRPSLSATRAEKFSDCRFAYFLQYGMKARPRQRAVFDPRDYGTFMHYVLENTARAAMDEGGFAAVSRRRIGELTDLCVDRYIHEELNDFAEKNERFEYLFRRLRSTVRRVTEDMWEELKDSRFQPIDLELDLAADGVLDPSEEDGFRTTGRADRVDGWVKDGVLYLRITDYKTGRKQFSLSDVCEGVNIQMLMYLFTLEARGRTHFGASEIRPAGVLYSPARFDAVRADGEPTDEELAALRRSTAKRSGLVLADGDVIEAMEPGEEKKFLPVKLKKTGEWTQASLGSLASLEQFGALGKYIGQTLRDMTAELRAGSVTADPWFKSARDNACAWCDYAKACLFDEERDAWRVRQSLSPQEAWEKIENGAEEAGS